MLTNKNYCDYETCVALKELGYKTPASAFYMPNNETLHFVSNPYRGGYVIDCFRSHNSLREDVMTHDFIDAPTMWEAQKWLREEKEVEVAIIPEYNEFAPVKGVQYRVWVSHWKDNEFGYETIEIVDEETRIPFLYKTYTEALSEGVKCAVKILKEK